MALPGAPPLDLALIEQIAPLTLTGERLLAVPSLLESLFIWGGIPPGWSIGVAGNGAWSMAMAIWAEALGAEGWIAIVGAPDVNLVTAAELGVRLDRVVVIETPPTKVWTTVVGALIEAFDIVAIAPGGPVGLRDARRLSARAREQGAVLFHLDGARSWPTAVDLTLTGSTQKAGWQGGSWQGGSWQGVGDGHGHLRARCLRIDAVGRRAGRTRSTTVLLPGPDGVLAPFVEP